MRGLCGGYIDLHHRVKRCFASVFCVACGYQSPCEAAWNVALCGSFQAFNLLAARTLMFAKINHVAIVSERYALLGKFYEALFGMKMSGTKRSILSASPESFPPCFSTPSTTVRRSRS